MSNDVREVGDFNPNIRAAGEPAVAPGAARQADQQARVTIWAHH